MQSVVPNKIQLTQAIAVATLRETIAGPWFGSELMAATSSPLNVVTIASWAVSQVWHSQMSKEKEVSQNRRVNISEALLVC